MTTTNNSSNTKDVPDLYRKSVMGGIWVFGLRISLRIIFTARYLVFLHFITIDDLGLLGIAMLMIDVLNKFTNTGFNAALIQKKDNVDGYLDTAWTVNIIRSVILFAILYFTAPYLAMLKVPPEKVALAVTVIRAVGLLMIASAFNNIGLVYFRKELQFNKRFIFEVSATLVNIIVSISIAIVYRSIWSLVLGRLTAALTRCLLSYLMHPYRPALKFDLPKAREMWSFGKWVFAMTIINFLLTQGDDLFVWGLLGPAALLMYQLAYKFSNISATEITTLINQVTFPAYSKIQDDIPRLRDAYLKVLQLTAFLSIPIAGLIFILTPDFVHLFFPAGYTPVIRPMQILAVSGMLMALGATMGPVLQAVGKLGPITKVQVAKFILFAFLIYPLTTRFGLTGTAIVVLAIKVIFRPFEIYLFSRAIYCNFWDRFKQIMLPLTATLLTIIVITCCKRPILTEVTLVWFFILAIIGLCTYTAIVYVFDRVLGYGIVKNIREQLSTMTQKNR